MSMYKRHTIDNALLRKRMKAAMQHGDSKTSVYAIGRKKGYSYVTIIKYYGELTSEIEADRQKNDALKERDALKEKLDKLVKEVDAWTG